MDNARYYAYELVWDGLPRYVSMARAGEPAPWRAVWAHRHEIPNRLGRWLTTLDEPPSERIVLGGSVRLTERAARAVVAGRLGQIARMAGTSPDWPDFVENERRVNVGKRGRQITVIEGETVTIYPSVASLARMDGVARSTRAHHRQMVGGRIIV